MLVKKKDLNQMFTLQMQKRKGKHMEGNHKEITMMREEIKKHETEKQQRK